MQAVRTEYKGIGFRSRLEAGWALLLDRLGIDYEYEKQSFEFCNGEWYLPDFYLPDMDAFLEIKGESISDLAIRKMAKLVYCTGEQGIILLGSPCEFMAFAFLNQRVIREGPFYVRFYRMESGRFIESILHRREVEFINRASEEATFENGGSRSGDVSHYDFTQRPLGKVGTEWQLGTEGHAITPAVIGHISFDLPFRFQGGGRGDK